MYLELLKSRSRSSIQEYLQFKVPPVENKFEFGIESEKKGKEDYYYLTRLPKDILGDYLITEQGQVNYQSIPKTKAKLPKKQSRKKITKRSAINKSGGGTKKNITWNSIDSEGNDIVDNSSDDLSKLEDFSSIDLDSLETININDNSSDSDEEEELFGNNDKDNLEDNLEDNLVGNNKNLEDNLEEINFEENNENTKNIFKNTDNLNTENLNTDKDKKVDGDLSPISIPEADLLNLSTKPTPLPPLNSDLLPTSTSPPIPMEGGAEIKNITITPGALDASSVADSMKPIESEDVDDNLFTPPDVSISPPPELSISEPPNLTNNSTNVITIDTQPQN